MAATRRGALAALLVGQAGVAPALTVANPDAAIVRKVAAMVANDAEANRVLDALDIRGPDGSLPVAPALEARRDRLTREYLALSRQVAGARALTPSGLQAKAQALMLWLAPGEPDDAGFLESEQGLAWSLCPDLLATPGEGA